jgi:hypothetical protein
MRRLIPLLLVGCTPHLVSVHEEITGANWDGPENGWSAGIPPNDLKGEGFAKGQVPHDFRLMAQTGETVALWQFYGSVIVLDISTMWCRPCQQIAAEVKSTFNSYKDEGFMYVTLLPEDIQGDIPDKADLNQWTDSFGIGDTVPVLQDDQGYSYAVEPNEKWPAVLLIDREMRVIAERLSPDDEVIRAAIEEAL